MGGHQADVAEQGARRASWDDRRVLNGCFSPHLYRARNLVERFFNKIKQCRRVATRYDKLAASIHPTRVNVAARL
jgi:transposase